MRTIETKLYTYDELNDRAQERARDWFRECSYQETDWADSVIEDVERMTGLFGLTIGTHPVKLMNGSTRRDPTVYWGVASRDSGASYAGSYAYKKGSVRAVAAEAPPAYQGTVSASNTELNRIVGVLADVQKRHFYQVQASIGHGRDWRLSIDVDRADGKPIADEDIETVTEALRDVARWIHRALELEYEYRQSDDTVADDIRANDYEFHEDGTRA
jgi:hypothetical protein